MLNSLILALLTILGFGIFAIKAFPYFSIYSQSVSCRIKQLSLETNSMIGKLFVQIEKASNFNPILSPILSLFGYNFNSNSIIIKTNTGCKVRFMNATPRQFYNIYENFLRVNIPGIYFYGKIIPSEKENFEEILKGNFIFVQSETISFTPSSPNNIFNGIVSFDVKYTNMNEVFLSNLINKTIVLVFSNKPLNKQRLNEGEYFFYLDASKLDSNLLLNLISQTKAFESIFWGWIKDSENIYISLIGDNKVCANLIIDLFGDELTLKKFIEKVKELTKKEPIIVYGVSSQIYQISPSKLNTNKNCKNKNSELVITINLKPNTANSYTVSCYFKVNNNYANLIGCYEEKTKLTSMSSNTFVGEYISNPINIYSTYFIPLETSVQLANYIGGKLIIVYS